ncbi:MAG TPA: PKD domain-containing protein [Candidatus Thermoplasmatota archaeon]|nr:PKD domain-containing protein [Candidatus Thermoplasmatota archaeon]
MKKKLLHYMIGVSVLLTTFSAIGIPYVSADPPVEPYQPIPSAGSSSVTVFVDLQWTSGDVNTTYDVYFGIENPPPLVLVNQSVAVFEPDRLLLNTTYYWQIVAHNIFQESTSGPIWNFTTAGNQPPFKPKVLDGPPQAGKGIPLEFMTVAPDPEGDQVSYQWDWGDGNVSDWFGPFDFGQRTSAIHEWADNGTYEVKVRARDELGKQSSWSSAYNVTIAPQVELSNCKPGYLYFVFLTFDKTYGYIYSLDLLGVSLIISTGGMRVFAGGSDSVNTVVFEMQNKFLDDQRWNATSINETGNAFEGYFYLNDGLYETTAYAYDSEGRLIDRATRNYVIYYEWKFIILKQLLGITSP